MASSSREDDLLGGFERALRTLPGLEVCSVQRQVMEGSLRIDAEVAAVVKGHPVRLLVEAKGSAYPRDLAVVARQFARLTGSDGTAHTAAVVLAPSISPGGRELLREDRIGYWDTGDSLYLELPWAVYLVERPAPAAAERRLQRPYHGRSAQVLHTLLVEPEQTWNLQALAECAGVSPYTAHQVLRFLFNHSWAECRGSRRRSSWILRQPGELLGAWAEAHSLREYTHLRFHGRAPSMAVLRREVAYELEAHGVEYALTLGSGAELVAPFATQTNTVHLLVGAQQPALEAAKAAGLKAAEGGENVVFLVSTGGAPLMFRQRVEEVCVASDIQVYLDLYASPTRGREQAQHLRSERIGF